jgi:predicted transcriptional regulator
MPETLDTANEIVKIKQDIRDIKHSQEADMHLNREKYEELVYSVLNDNPTRVKVFLAIDGTKSRRELQDVLSLQQNAVWRAVDYLESHGLIFELEQTKRGSPIYGKPRWVRTLRIDDYARKKFSHETPETERSESETGDSNIEPVT